MNRLGKLVRRLQKLASSTFTSSGLSATLDRAVFRIAGRSGGASATGMSTAGGDRARSDAAPHVLLAPPGGGNIGDQAMVESFLENTDGRVVIVVRSAADIAVPPAFTSRVTTVELSALLYRDGIAHLRDVRRYHSLVSRARSVSVIGADIMDGLYSLRASVRRSNAAELAASIGVDTRILGFSWNGSPKPAARAALVKATRAGAVAMLRDPASAARARQQGVQNVADVADTVFAARTVDETIVSRIGLPEGVAGRLVIVNASGLIAKKLDQLAEYETIIAQLRAGGRHVLLLPHVSRPLADDAVTCRAIFERVGSDGVTLVDRLLQPAEIRGLTSIAEFVITGRMHLAIQAMYNGKPAITLSTQGKVEGLMQLFASEDLAVEPVAGFSAPIGRVIDSLFADGPGRAARITDALPHVTALSQSNFARISAEPAPIES